MKIDLYTKSILTVIAIGIGCLVFEQKPVKEAHAAGNLEKRVHVIEMNLRKASQYECRVQHLDEPDRNGRCWSDYNAALAWLAYEVGKYR